MPRCVLTRKNYARATSPLLALQAGAHTDPEGPHSNLRHLATAVRKNDPPHSWDLSHGIPQQAWLTPPPPRSHYWTLTLEQQGSFSLLCSVNILSFSQTLP